MIMLQRPRPLLNFFRKHPSSIFNERKRTILTTPIREKKGVQVGNKLKEPEGKQVRLSQRARDSFLIFEARRGPFGKTVAGIGQGVVAAGAVFGSGGIIYYGLKSLISADADETDHIGLPEYVQQRIRSSYMYMANSLAFSSIGAFISFKLFSKPSVLNFVASRPILAIGATMGTQLFVAMFVRSLPYEEGVFGGKQVGSIVQALLIGIAAAPFYLLGAQSIIRAGFVSAGVVSGLTGLSTMLPDNTFKGWDLPLRMAIYATFVSFIGLWFLPRTHVFYNLCWRIGMHGGLVLFPINYLHNSKNLVKSATFNTQFDPINSSMSMSNDVLNIYGRLAFLLPPYYLISGSGPGGGASNTIKTILWGNGRPKE